MAKKKKSISDKKKCTLEQENLECGIKIIKSHGFFGHLFFYFEYGINKVRGSNIPYIVMGDGRFFVNDTVLLSPKQWANAMAHKILHHAFGHFDAEKMPGYEHVKEDGTTEKIVQCNERVWNIACDAYINRFLADLKFGESIYEFDFMDKIRTSADELEIYQYLMENGEWKNHEFIMDMQGLDQPHYYSDDDCNYYAKAFANNLIWYVGETVYRAGGHEEGVLTNEAEDAAEWFINCYPLLGSLAASFKIIYDAKICIEEEIQIAAVDANAGKIYVNPSAGLTYEELKFVLAHEYLHAGLQHRERCQGRNLYLWNVACDFVINAWLVEMKIGCMPSLGLLYDEKLNGMSAEEIYDLLLPDGKKISKWNTFRGYGMGDIVGEGEKNGYGSGINLDDFFKSALAQGLEFHQGTGRGTLPVGLIEEIRALAVPPVPWDVALARWIQEFFPLPEKKRSYARVSRRQGSTPDIPRPKYIENEEYRNSRTFGVIIDTSSSMSSKMIGLALGAIASYAVARGVAHVRVIFCDACAYDAGYMSPEEIAGNVKVEGRGGTIIQSGIDLLESVKDFPKDGPILIITDGEIENNLRIYRKHAFLIPKGKNLPFKARGEVFRFEET